MQGNSAPMSGHAQKVLSCTEVGFTSWTTPNSIMTWCMCIMEPPSQDTLDDGRCWNWCHGTTDGQGYPGMLPSLSWDATHATGVSSIIVELGAQTTMLPSLSQRARYRGKRS